MPVPKPSRCRRRPTSIARLVHQVLLPRWRFNLDREPIRTGGQQELASPSALEKRALVVAEVEGALKLRGLAGPLRSEEGHRRIRRDHRTWIRAEEVARILSGEDKRALVLADAARQADHEAPDGGVFEEQAELVDDQHAPSILALDPRPQRLGQQKVHRRDHLVTQLAHAKGDDRRLEVDVGGRAEHLAETALHPAAKNRRHSRSRWQSLGNIAKHGLTDVAIDRAHGAFDHRPLGFIETATHSRAEIHRVGRSWTEPAFVVAIGRAQVEHVERVAGAQRKLHVDSTEQFGQAAVLVLRINEEHLHATTEGRHRKRREQVGLACARMAEDRDVGVGVALVVEGIEHDRPAGCAIGANDQTTGLGQLRVQPGQHRRQRAGVEHSLATHAVQAGRLGRQIAVEHAERAWFEPAQDSLRGGVNALGGYFELGRARSGDCHVGRDMKGPFLAGGQPALEVLCRRQGTRKLRIGGLSLHAAGTHRDQLSLQVADDPGGRQRGRVPRKAHAETGRQQAEQPSRLELVTGEAIDVPAAAHTTRV